MGEFMEKKELSAMKILGIFLLITNPIAGLTFLYLNKKFNKKG
jgi:hypothetical protein